MMPRRTPVRGRAVSTCRGRIQTGTDRRAARFTSTFARTTRRTMGTSGSTCLNRPRHARPNMTAVLTLVFGVACFAQEGHPLVGTWRGEWGPDTTERHYVTIVME